MGKFSIDTNNDGKINEFEIINLENNLDTENKYKSAIKYVNQLTSEEKTKFKEKLEFVKKMRNELDTLGGETKRNNFLVEFEKHVLKGETNKSTTEKKYFNKKTIELKIEKNIENSEKNLKETLNDFYEAFPIDFISKNQMLDLFDGDYLQAITSVIIYKNEQMSSELFDGRHYKKAIMRFLNKWVPATKHIKEVRSTGPWQIRPFAFDENELNIFFANDLKEKDYKFINNEDLALFNELKAKYKANYIKYLVLVKENNKSYFNKSSKEKQKERETLMSKDDRVKLLKNKGLSTYFMKSMLNMKKRRMESLLKRNFGIEIDKNKLGKKEIFFYTSNLANSYHLSTSPAIKLELFTNIVLKNAEKLDLLKSEIHYYKNDYHYGTSDSSFQVLMRKEAKKITGGSEVYVRNRKILKNTLNLILGSNFIQSEYSKNEISDLKIEIDNFKRIPSKKIINFINEISKINKINPIDFTTDDYRNTDSNKAMLVGNYGTRPWIKLENIKNGK